MSSVDSLEIKPRTIYLAGPMTGYPGHNEAAFRAFQRLWAGFGWQAETPLEANSRVWQKHYGVPYDPWSQEVDYGHPLLPEMFAEDLATLARSDAIALLPGWERSNGVSRELATAILLGKTVYDALTMRELKLDCVVGFGGQELFTGRSISVISKR
jgi:hypothetical protein